MRTNITEDSIKFGIEDMLKKGCKHFSATKIGQVSYAGSKFLNELSQIKKLDSDLIDSSSCYHGDDPNENYPHFFIIGSKKDAAKSTDRLVKMVEECPKGELFFLLRAAFRTYWGGDKFFNEYVKELDKGEKILKVIAGPIFYNVRQIKDIADLFLFPTVRYFSDTEED